MAEPITTNKALAQQNIKDSRALLKKVAIAYELLALLKNPENAPHVAHIASRLSWDFQTSDIEHVFYDIQTMTECYEDADMEKTMHASIRASLRDITNRQNLNPPLTGEDKILLDDNSLKIIENMVNNPEDCPKLFLDLCSLLDRLIKEQGLSVPAAGKEIQCTLDRPQIMHHSQLQKAVALGYLLELPETIRRQEPEVAWKAFMAALPKSLDT